MNNKLSTSSDMPVLNHPELIRTLYASLVDKEGFHPFLKELAESIGAFSAVIAVLNRHPLRLEHGWYHGLPDEFVTWYLENNMIEQDLVFNYAVLQPPGEFQTVVSLLDDFDRKAKYERWVKDQNMLDAAWLVAHTTENHVIAMVFQRTTEQGPYSETEIQQLNELVAFIRQAIQLYQQFNDQDEYATSLAGVINAIANPTFVLNEAGKVLYTNKSAKALLADQSALYLRNDRFVFRNERDRTEFLVSFNEAVRSSMGQQHYQSNTVFIKRPGKVDLIVTVAPLEVDKDHRGGALVTMYDPDMRKLPSAKAIAAYFSLTPTEATICAELISGRSLKEIADLHNKKEETVRSQLKQIFQKTNQNRQGQLISSILAALMY